MKCLNKKGLPHYYSLPKQENPNGETISRVGLMKATAKYILYKGDERIILD
jgi:hypothetical protein